jgi:hypothetical protein
LARFEFESGIVLFWFSFTFVSFGESCLYISWCAGGRCGLACSDEGRGRSRRPVAEDQGWSHRSGTRWPGGREVEWRCVWFAPCTWIRGARVPWLILKSKVRRFVSGLASKPLRRFLPVWPQNRWRRFLAVWPQNLLRRFSLVWPQNQWRRFSPVWPQNW